MPLLVRKDYSVSLDVRETTCLAVDKAWKASGDSFPDPAVEQTVDN